MKRFISLILTVIMVASAIPVNVLAIPTAVDIMETVEAAPMPEVEEDTASDEEKKDSEKTDKENDDEQKGDEQKGDEQKATLSADTCCVYGTVSLPEGMTFDKDVLLKVWIYGDDGYYTTNFLLPAGEEEVDYSLEVNSGVTLKTIRLSILTNDVPVFSTYYYVDEDKISTSNEMTAFVVRDDINANFPLFTGDEIKGSISLPVDEEYNGEEIEYEIYCEGVTSGNYYYSSYYTTSTPKEENAFSIIIPKDSDEDYYLCVWVSDNGGNSFVESYYYYVSDGEMCYDYDDATAVNANGFYKLTFPVGKKIEGSISLPADVEYNGEEIEYTIYLRGVTSKTGHGTSYSTSTPYEENKFSIMVPKDTEDYYLYVRVDDNGGNALFENSYYYVSDGEMCSDIDDATAVNGEGFYKLTFPVGKKIEGSISLPADVEYNGEKISYRIRCKGVTSGKTFSKTYTTTTPYEENKFSIMVPKDSGEDYYIYVNVSDNGDNAIVQGNYYYVSDGEMCFDIDDATVANPDGFYKLTFPVGKKIEGSISLPADAEYNGEEIEYEICCEGVTSGYYSSYYTTTTPYADNKFSVIVPKDSDDTYFLCVWVSDNGDNAIIEDSYYVSDGEMCYDIDDATAVNGEGFYKLTFPTGKKIEGSISLPADEEYNGERIRYSISCRGITSKKIFSKTYTTTTPYEENKFSITVPKDSGEDYYIYVNVSDNGDNAIIEDSYYYYVSDGEICYDIDDATVVNPDGFYKLTFPTGKKIEGSISLPADVEYNGEEIEYEICCEGVTSGYYSSYYTTTTPYADNRFSIIVPKDSDEDYCISVYVEYNGGNNIVEGQYYYYVSDSEMCYDIDDATAVNGEGFYKLTFPVGGKIEGSISLPDDVEYNGEKIKYTIRCQGVTSKETFSKTYTTTTPCEENKFSIMVPSDSGEDYYLRVSVSDNGGNALLTHACYYVSDSEMSLSSKNATAVNSDGFYKLTFQTGDKIEGSISLPAGVEYNGEEIEYTIACQGVTSTTKYGRSYSTSTPCEENKFSIIVPKDSGYYLSVHVNDNGGNALFAWSYYYYVSDGEVSSDINNATAVNKDGFYKLTFPAGKKIEGTIHFDESSFISDGTYEFFVYAENIETGKIYSMWSGDVDSISSIPYKIVVPPENAEKMIVYAYISYISPNGVTNVSENYHYYSSDGTTLSETDATVIDASNGISGVDITISSSEVMVVNLSYEEGCFINESLCIDVYAEDVNSGEVYYKSIYTSKADNKKIIIPVGDEPGQYKVYVFIDEPYDSSACNVRFGQNLYYSKDKIVYSIEQADVVSSSSEISITIPQSKTLSGKIVLDDDYKHIEEFAKARIKIESDSGEGFTSYINVDSDLNYSVSIPHSISGECEVSISFDSSSNNNIIKGTDFYHCNKNGDKKTVTVPEDESVTGVDIHAQTGFVVSGVVKFPEGYVFEGSSIDYDITFYSSTSVELGEDKSEAEFMVAVPRSYEGKTYILSGRTYDFVEGLYTGKIYYKTSSSVVYSTDEATSILVAGDVGGLVLTIPYGITFKADIKNPSAVDDVDVNVELKTASGKSLSDEWVYQDRGENTEYTHVLPITYADEELYLRYKIYRYNFEYPFYTEWVYVNPDGTYTGAKKLAKPFRISELSAMDITLADCDSIIMPEYVLESPHPYKNDSKETYVYTHPEQADFLEVTFSEETYTQYGDYVYIYDKNGNLIDEYYDDDLSGKTINIPGDTFTITLKSNTYDNAFGFAIESVVGTNYVLESEHPYANNSDIYYYYVHPEKAEALDITFSSDTEFEKNRDYLYLYDEDGYQFGKYTGTSLKGKTVRYEGDSFKLRLVSDSSSTKYGFSITSIETVHFYTVTFRNYDGKVLESCIVEEGQSAYYDGKTPKRPSDDNYAYNFIGWDKDFSNVTSDMTVTAVFEEIPVYTVIFQNYDGTVLETARVVSGDDAEYYGDTPSRPKNGNISYTFIGWDVDLTNITKDTVATAVFKERIVYLESEHPYGENCNVTYSYEYDGEAEGLKITFSEETYTEYYFDVISIYDGFGNLIGEYSGDMLSGKSVKVEGNSFKINLKSDSSSEDFGFEVIGVEPTEIEKFTVTFQNYDGTVLYTQSVIEGNDAMYLGDEPEREPDDEFMYFFDGWDTEFTNITCDTVITACFYEEPYSVVTFKDYDGTVISKQLVPYWDNCYYEGEYPSRERDETYIYEFIGWDADLHNVTEDIEATAMYEAYEYRTVTYKNYDGTVLYEDYVYLGDSSWYGAPVPYKPYAGGVGYLFVGWDAYPYKVYEDITTTAVFTETDVIPISTEEELRGIADEPCRVYVLTGDIELTEEWIPIYFDYGVLDGCGYKISNVSMTGDENSGNFLAVFDQLEYAVVKNLSLEVMFSANEYAESVSGFAESISCSLVENVHVEGVLECDNYDWSEVSGFASYISCSKIDSCSVMADIESKYNAYGFCSDAWYSKITNSFFNGSLTFTGSEACVYGFANASSDSNTAFENCYSNAEVSIVNEDILIYEASPFVNIYTSENYRDIFVENCYYNEESFGLGALGYPEDDYYPDIRLEVIDLGTPLTGEEMKNEASFAGFDFENVWSMDDGVNNGLPFIKKSGNSYCEEHTFDEWKVIEEPSCEEQGYKRRACTVCSYIERETILALGHDYSKEWTIDVEPTCLVTGLKSYYCLVCGETTQSTVIDALGHDYSEWNTVVSPTCTEDGKEEMVCLREDCGYSKTNILPMLGHDFAEEWTVDIEPTCTKEGSKSHHCSRCPEKADVTVIEAHGHDYDEWKTRTPATCTKDGLEYRTCQREECGHEDTNVLPMLGHDFAEEWTVDIEPTCTKEGSKSHHCSRCPEKADVTVIEAHGHDYDEFKTRTPATCTKDGLEYRTCQREKCGHEDTNVLPMLGHDFSEEWTVDIEPTCTKEGSKSHHCSRCPEKADVTVIEAHGHDYDEWKTRTPATCTKDGLEYRTCQREKCGHEETNVLPMLGHDFAEEWTVDIEPTCTKEGSKSHHCSRCPEKAEVTVIEAHGHDYDEFKTRTPATCTKDGLEYRTCQREKCGHEETNVLPMLGHDFSEEWTVDIEPTCTKEGSKSHHCSRCPEKADITVIEPHGHDYDEWKTRTPATCTKDGLEYRTCQREKCGHEDTNVLPMLGHDFAEEWTVDIEPTCTKEGSKSHHCSRCSEKADVTVIEAHGHDYDEWKTRTPATCTKDGLEYRTCQREKCGHEETNILPMLGHDFAEEWTVDIEPTCTKEGSKSHHCSRCSEKADVTVIEALGHDYDEWKTRTPATCTKDGLEYRTCQREKCGHEETNILPMLGHDFAEEWTVDIDPTCTKEGSKSHHCSRCSEKSDITVVDALGHAYGEWITEKEETIFADGLKRRICSRCKHEETETIPKTEIDISDDDDYGVVNFTVVNAKTLEPIEEAKIFISTESDGKDTVVTDKNGEVSVVMPTGKHTLPVFADSYMTRNILITVSNCVQDVPVIGLSDEPLVNAEIVHHEMTLEEIREAGIDTSNPANQHIVRYELKFDYEPEIDLPSLFAYFNLDGICVGFGPASGVPGVPGAPDVDGPDNPDGDDSDGGSGGSGTPGSGSGGHRYVHTLPSGETMTVIPASEKFFLIITGESKWLKEMYKVEMLIYNNSYTDSIEDCVAELTIPEGLSLAAMRADAGNQSYAYNVDYIEPGGTKLLNWYVSGDKEGSYDVKASLDGVLMPFEEEFHHEYVADSPIKVYAGSALHMTIEAPGVTHYNEDYPVKVTIENVSHKPIYNISHMIYGLKQCRVVWYSDGSVKEEVYISQASGERVSSEVFNPGDKLIIEFTTNIMFQSELIKYNLEKLTKAVDGIEMLLNLYKSADLVTSTIDFVYNWAKGLSDNIDKVFKDTHFTDLDKIKAYNKLGISLEKFALKLKMTDSEAVRVANKLKGTEYYNLLLELSGDDADLTMYATETIEMLSAVLEKTLEECEEEDKAVRNFDFYDSIKTAIMAIPVRFALKEVAVTELSGSTTEIPFDVKMTANNSIKYFGVSNVGNYVKNLVIASAGKIDLPWYMNILGAEDDPLGYEEAVKEIIATEKEIETFAAQSASGKTKVSVWVDGSGASLQAEHEDEGSFGDFTISCNNETAYTDKDGVLHFTGAGYIDVVPNGTKDGVLHVRMEEDGAVKETIFNISVVEKHVCRGTEWTTLVVPDEEECGYSVMLCDVCHDTIDVKNVELCSKHNFGESVVVKEAADDKEGLGYRECEDCKHRSYVTIPTYIPGDIDNNGFVDMNDAVLLLQHSMFPDIIVLDYKGDIDFVDDDAVDMNDAVLLLQHSMFPDLIPLFK